MTRNAAISVKLSELDAGELLPGCSIPIAHPDVAPEKWRHAFREFRPLPIDGLSASAAASLADSMADVARSIRVMHESKFCYGRISSTSFHNRGTLAEPLASLWVDSRDVVESDAVHSGDPESMYWTDARLQSGADPTPADDWYALGVVLAEIALSSTAVHKIWELSRRDGGFADSLIKNLARSRGNKRLAKMAITLIRQGATGTVSQAAVSALAMPRQSGHRKPMYFAIATLVVTAVALAWGLYQTSVEAEHRRKLYAQLGTKMDQLRRQVDVLESEAASKPPLPTVAVPAAQTEVSTSNRERDRWIADVAGRSLEQAIESSQNLTPDAWGQTLIAISKQPGQKQWRTGDPMLRRIVQQVVNAPWDARLVAQANSRLDALNQAYGRWSDWARSRRGIDEIRTQHDLMPAGITKDALGQWLSEALEIQSFDLRVIVAAAGDENTFLAHVVGFETPAESKTLDWDWSTTEGDGETIELNVGEYHAGDSLSFWMQQDSSIPYWNRTVIEHTFDSPLLVWQLAKGLKLKDSESGYAVVLTTDKQFGPPIKLTTANSVGTQASDVDSGHEAVKRDLVDPVDALPFDLN